MRRFRQTSPDGDPFVKVVRDAGIIPGIKVDTGAKDLAGFPGEKVTEGLDALRVRLAEHFQIGARFAKWRAVISIGDCTPSRGCIDAIITPMRSHVMQHCVRKRESYPSSSRKS